MVGVVQAAIVDIQELLIQAIQDTADNPVLAEYRDTAEYQVGVGTQVTQAFQGLLVNHLVYLHIMQNQSKQVDNLQVDIYFGILQHKVMLHK